MNVQGAKSSCQHVVSGLCPGSIQLSGGSLSMFVDDLLLHKTINFLHDYLELQADVDALANG